MYIKMYVRFCPRRSIIARLFVMGGTSAQLSVSNLMSLPGHRQPRALSTTAAEHPKPAAPSQPHK
jgi:hypothetical protein